MTRNKKEIGMNPAALVAALRGDLANALVASTPGGIEAQEHAGQRAVCEKSILPKDCDRNVFEAMGIVFGTDADDLFVNVTFPEGWHKEATDHYMYSDLLDDKGRKRVTVCYKAAFYDRWAKAYANLRFHAMCEPIDGWENPDGVYVGVVKDQDKIIWRSEDTGTRGDYRKHDLLGAAATDWLRTHYPDYKNPLAYWED